MANKFITLDRAKTEIKRLQYYVNLVETYDPLNLEQEIIKEYAITSSIPEVSKRLNISSKGKDELHKIGEWLKWSFFFIFKIV